MNNQVKITQTEYDIILKLRRERPHEILSIMKNQHGKLVRYSVETDQTLVNLTKEEIMRLFEGQQRPFEKILIMSGKDGTLQKFAVKRTEDFTLLDTEEFGTIEATIISPTSVDNPGGIA